MLISEYEEAKSLMHLFTFEFSEFSFPLSLCSPKYIPILPVDQTKTRPETHETLQWLGCSKGMLLPGVISHGPAA